MSDLRILLEFRTAFLCLHYSILGIFELLHMMPFTSFSMHLLSYLIVWP